MTNGLPENRSSGPIVTRHWTHYLFVLVLLIGGGAITLARTGAGYSTYPHSVFARLTVRIDPADSSKIHLSGHIMGSFHCLGAIRQKRDNFGLNLRMVDPVLCGDQGGGDFAYSLDVGAPVQNITYGEERVRLNVVR